MKSLVREEKLTEATSQQMPLGSSRTNAYDGSREQVLLTGV
jgi:hypothetical protein